MKKNVLLVITMLMLCMSVFAAEKPTIYLWHNGQVKTYDVNGLPSAVNDAMDGDTIFLAKGSYPTGSSSSESIIITKAITLIGVGWDGERYSFIGSSVVISSSNVVFENVYVMDVSVNEYNCKFKKCRVSEISCSKHPVIMENCYIGRKVEHFTNSHFYNCYVCIGYGNTNSEFVNCDIETNKNYVQSPSISGSTFSSCRFDDDSGLENCVLFNCLYNSNSSPSTSNNLTNCYKYDGKVIRLSTSDLQSNGYLGVDGTVVGRYGGETPFTVAPNQPVVTANSITLDYENKQLNVSLEVKIGE